MRVLVATLGAPNQENRAEQCEFAPGPVRTRNRLTERHGFCSSILARLEQDGVKEIASALRHLSPLDSDALEPLVQLVAGQLWRRRRAYADLDANGVVRTRGKAAPILRDLETLERSILDGPRRWH